MVDEFTDADDVADDVAALQAEKANQPQTLTDRLVMAEKALAQGRRALVWLGYPELAIAIDLPIEELNEVLH